VYSANPDGSNLDDGAGGFSRDGPYRFFFYSADPNEV